MVRRLLAYAEELEAERDAPFDHVAAGVCWCLLP
jgi:hypothetical protein